MTNQMNFFQSLLMFESFAPVRMDDGKIELVNKLADEARHIAAEADEEATNGGKAQNVIKEANAAENKKLSQSLAEIAVWHYDRAAAKYREAVARFEAVANMRIRAKYREHFDKKAKEMAKRAAQAATANNQLNDFLNQK